MKRLISIILMIALSLGVTACDRSSANNYSQYREDGRLILTIWAPDQYAGQQVKQQFQGWLDKFNETEELKALGVYLQFSPMTQLPTSLGTACLSGPHKMPDIVVWDRFATPSNTKLLMPLDDLIAEDGVDVSKFFRGGVRRTDRGRQAVRIAARRRSVGTLYQHGYGGRI